MPVYFQFIERKTNEPIALNEIDARMCADQDIPCDPDHFCALFMTCQEVGTVSKLQNEEGCVDAEKLDAFLATIKETPPEYLALLRKYLVGDYTFSAWWQAKC